MPGYIGTVERYHTHLRWVFIFNKIRKRLYRLKTDQDCPKMTIFQANYSIVPEVLLPVILVF